MRNALAFLLLMCVMPRGDGASARDIYLYHVTKGDEFYRSFDNGHALAEYQKAYELAPDSFATLERMVRIYTDMGRLLLRKDPSSEVFYRKAVVYADSLAQRFPGRPESHFWLALSEGSLIPFGGAREKVRTARRVQEEANKAIEIDSGFAEAYVILGIFQREASNISWFERVLANVIFGADFSGTLSASESYLRKSVELNPKNSYGYYELYWTYKAMNDSARANQSLKQVLAISPSNARERLQNEEATRQLALMAKKP